MENGIRVADARREFDGSSMPKLFVSLNRSRSFSRVFDKSIPGGLLSGHKEKSGYKSHDSLIAFRLKEKK